MAETSGRGRHVAGALNTDIGVVRCFGGDDIREAGMVRGWAAPEDAHSWNDGPEAVLVLAADRPDFPCALVVEGAPLIVPARQRQDATLYVNGLRLGFWRLTDAARSAGRAVALAGAGRCRGADARVAPARQFAAFQHRGGGR